MQVNLSKFSRICILSSILLISFEGFELLHAQAIGDTLQTTQSDTIPPVEPAVSDTIPPPQTPPLISTEGSQPTSQVPQTRSAERQSSQDAVNFQARDSLTFNFRGQRIAYLYGSANVKHTNGELSAGTIELDLNKNQVEASTLTPEDTLSYPVLRQQQKDLRSTRVLFNYKTEKGKFEVAEMEVDDGYLIGTKVKNVSRSEVFIEDGIYSTCPPNHMYYYIKADRMKLVDEEEIFFTNARLYILDIPYPLIFPFGYVPAGIESRRSGLLEPTYIYQNTATRGIGVQNLGWFQYFNDYITGQASFDLFTSGTVFSEGRMQYRKTGNFNGSVILGYSYERGLEPTDPNFQEVTSRRIGITHDQQLSPFSNISANINLQSANYFQRNSFDPNERAQTSSTSRASYRYNHPEGLYNFSVSSNLNQQFATNRSRLSGPDASFSLKQFSPFQSGRTAPGDESWYERISVRYSNDFKSSYDFNPIAADSAQINWVEALFDRDKYEEATGNDTHIRYGFRQSASVNAGQIIPSQFVNMSASISYNEYWYPSTIRKELDEEENRLITRQEPGFAAARDFNTGLNFSTTFYGISQMKIGNFEGLRHTVRPTISFSYRPDFSEDIWGYFREVESDTLGNTQRYSIFEQAIFGGPSAGEQRAITLDLRNVLETKRVRRDSTGEVQSTNLRLIDNLSATAGYNFAADSLNLSRLNTTLSSRVVDGLRLSLNATYSFYSRDEQGREIDTFIWNSSNKILQPISYRLSLSTTFQGGSRGPRITTPHYRPYDPLNQAFFGPVDNRFNSQPIQQTNAPWQIGLDFSYRWNYRFNAPAQKSAVLNANNIQFNLTPKWRFNTSLGFDFIEKDLTPAQFSLQREMICWNLSFTFNPFGDFQYYFFRLSLSSAQISNLFQKLPGLNNLERSSSPSGRAPRF